jgi:phosphoglycolate phosphatase
MSAVRGLHDNGASSKIALGVALHAELELAPEQILLVGDTLHDAEVAAAIGCHCLLYGGGHQTRARLERAGVPVCDSLAIVAEVVFAP